MRGLTVLKIYEFETLVKNGDVKGPVTISCSRDSHMEYIAIAIQSNHIPENSTLRLSTEIMEPWHNMIPILVETLKSGKCPKGLIIKCNFITSYFKIICDALSHGNCPENLTMDFSYQKIGIEGARMIADALKSGKCPRGLKISFAQCSIFNDSEIQIIMDALISKNSPENITIDFSGNDLAAFGRTALSAITHNLRCWKAPKGILIDISDKDNLSRPAFLKDAIMEELAEVLKSGNFPQNSTIYLKYYSISENGFKLLARALRSTNCPQGITIDLTASYGTPHNPQHFSEILRVVSEGKCPFATKIIGLGNVIEDLCARNQMRAAMIALLQPLKSKPNTILPVELLDVVGQFASQQSPGVIRTHKVRKEIICERPVGFAALFSARMTSIERIESPTTTTKEDVCKKLGAQ